MYDPVTAQFLQQDTHRGHPGDALSLNLYSYCANNPLIYTDPTGHCYQCGVNNGMGPVECKKERVKRANMKMEQTIANTGTALTPMPAPPQKASNKTWYGNVWDTATDTVKGAVDAVNNKVVQPVVNTAKSTYNNYVEPVINKATSFVNNNVIEPVKQTYNKTKEVVDYIIENPPNDVEDVLALGGGAVVAFAKQRIVEPLLIDLPTLVAPVTGMSFKDIQRYRTGMQQGLQGLEDGMLNFFGIQDNEYYYARGTLGSTFDMASGIVESVVGGLIFTAGTGVNGASIGGSPAGGVSLAGTLVGVPAMALGGALGAHGISSTLNGYRGVNVNYNRFDELTRWKRLTSNEIKWTNHGYKHFPPKNTSWKEIVKSTKKGPAKYKPEINIEGFERAAWENGTPVTNGKSWKVYEADDIIGAKDGIETTYVRIEMSADTIHGHPITPAEYKKLTK